MVSRSSSSENLADGTQKGSSSNNGGSSGGGSGKQAALKKGPWTAAEDAILVDYVKKNGEGNWNAVRKNTSLARCGKSCRLRWTNHLRPNLKKGSFTPEEERIILQLHAQLGNKWARMAAQLPGRTDNEIKNYWNTRIKRRIRQGLPLYPPDVSSQKPPTSPPLPPSSPEPQFMSEPSTTFRARPQIQIPTRTLSPTFGQSPPHSLSPIALSPQSYNQLKTTFTNSLSLFETPATSPTSTRLNGSHLFYNDPNLNPNPNLSSYLLPYSPTNNFSNVNSFQFSALNYNINSSQNLQPTQHDLIYSELPSNQTYLLQTENPENGTGTGLNPQCHGGLLDDLLKDTGAFSSHNDLQDTTRQSNLLMNLQDEKLFDFSSTGLRIKSEANDQIDSISMHEDLSKLLDDIPSSSGSQMPEQHNNDNDNNNNNELQNNTNQSQGYNPEYAEGNITLEMQQIASFLDGEESSATRKEPPSRSWNSFARIC